MTFSVIPWNDSVDELGRGVFGATGERRATPFGSKFLKPDEKDFSKGSTLTFETNVAKTAEDVLKHFGVSASANVPATLENVGGSVDALTKKIQDMTNDTNCVHLLSSGVKEYSVSYIRERNLLWNKEKLLPKYDSMTSADYVKKFGDCFISGVVKGAYFHAIMTVRTNSRENTEEVTKSLNAAAKYMATDASFKSNSKDILKKISKDYEMEITVYFSGISEMQLTTSVDDLANKMGKFCEKATAEAAFPTYAILQEYCALPNFGGFSTDHQKMSSLFKQHEIASKVNLIYDYLRTLELFQGLCAKPKDFVPAYAIYCPDADSFSAEHMRSEYNAKWQAKHALLEVKRDGIKEYLADPSHIKLLPDLKPLWQLGIVEEELPITKAEARTKLFGALILKYREPTRIDFPIEMIGVPKIYKASRELAAYVRTWGRHIKISDLSSRGFTAVWTTQASYAWQETFAFSYIARCDDTDPKKRNQITVKSYEQVHRIY